MYLIGLHGGKLLLNLGGTPAKWSTKRGAMMNIVTHFDDGVPVKDDFLHIFWFKLTWFGYRR
jgi:hypothetical protein